MSSAIIRVKHAPLKMIQMRVELAMTTPLSDLTIDPPGVIVTAASIHPGQQTTVSHCLQLPYTHVTYHASPAPKRIPTTVPHANKELSFQALLVYVRKDLWLNLMLDIARRFVLSYAGHACSPILACVLLVYQDTL